MGVVDRINRLALLFDDPISKLMARHGLERGEFNVLATLRRARTARIVTRHALSRSHPLSGGLTDRLKRLAAKGLIERRPDSVDKGSDLVRLTAAGCEAVDAAFGADMALEAELIAKLGAGRGGRDVVPVGHRDPRARGLEADLAGEGDPEVDEDEEFGSEDEDIPQDGPETEAA
jgi:DNA-binding MarR family transcriptional regulator